jgi:hypothetical protein
MAVPIAYPQISLVLNMTSSHLPNDNDVDADMVFPVIMVG